MDWRSGMDGEAPGDPGESAGQGRRCSEICAEALRRPIDACITTACQNLCFVAVTDHLCYR